MDPPDFDSGDLASEVAHRALTEVALLLVAAAGRKNGCFPMTSAGISDLIGEIEPRLPEGTRVVVTPRDNEGEGVGSFREGVEVRVKPSMNGSLSVLAVYESGGFSADLHPDGRLTEKEVSTFVEPPGPGTPATLSPTAQADAMEILRRHEEGDEVRPRLALTELKRVIPAPSQSSDSVVITSVELYTAGVVVNYLVLNPSHEEPDLELPVEMYRGAGMAPPVPEEFYEWERSDGRNPLPDLDVADDLGTTYFRGGGGGHGDPDVWRAVAEYTPAVPSPARFLILTTYAGSVEFALRGGGGRAD